MSARTAFAGALLLLAVQGCDLLDGSRDPGTQGETPGDSAAAPAATVAQDTSAAAPQAADTGAAPRDTLTSPAGAPDTAAGPASAGDTLPQPLSAQDTVLLRLEERLEALQAQNDSLRSTILGLAALQGARTRQAARSDTAGTAGDILERGAEEVQNWGIRIFLTILFLVLVAGLVRGVVWLLDRLSERNAKRRLFFKRLVPISRILIWALAVPFAALVILGIDASGILAAGAAIGVAVGFAAQDILKNIFGGIIVLFDQPFQVGDKVSVQGTYGEVVSIGLRSTRLVTPDDNLVTVPNSQVVQDQVANANAGELNCQVVTDLYLPGRVDEAAAKRIAFEAAATSPYIFLNKPLVVLVQDQFERTFYTRIRVKGYVLDPRYEFLFQSDVTERARAGFRAAGILPPLQVDHPAADPDRLPRAPGVLDASPGGRP